MAKINLTRILLCCGTACTLSSAPGLAATAPLAPADTSTTASSTATSDGAQPLPAGPFVAPQSSDVEPQWGKIRSLWGKIRSLDGDEATPFWGKIRSFWGDVGPFDGDTAGFWGSLHTYNETDPKKATPQWSKIRSFWDATGSSWAALRPSWDSGDYGSATTQLKSIVDNSASIWGAVVKEKTKNDFYTAFANPLLGKYGISLSDPNSLAKLDTNQREHFFLEWYDGLMQFSGADDADYWMRMVNWSPSITQTLGSGKDTTIGLLDFTVSDPLAAHVDNKGGASKFDNGHGDAVVSLIAAPHDGKGIMGFAPQAHVLSYNPFDTTQTAGWTDIKTGIAKLAEGHASVVNMSLGVSGWTLHPEWNNVLNDPVVAQRTATTVFVLAAGNDGLAQTQNIAWTNSAGFVIVGSVDPASQISSFSNRPGEACLLTPSGCDKLMNHFIVAPGEMMLVSDGNGGTTRYSGTSFAAPLVSGTIALIHDRWPWLAQKPTETVSIILKTARDLGDAGPDAVYGFGMLDVTRALSPIDYKQLVWFQMDDKGYKKPISMATMQSSASSSLAAWEASSAYFFAFEAVGTTYRDFAIPLSTKLLNGKAVLANGQQVMSYLYNQAIGWMKTAPSLADRAALNYSATSAAVPPIGELDVTVSIAPRTMPSWGFRQGLSPYQTALRLSSRDRRIALKLGNGDGAVELGGNLGFSHAADYDPATGGANPLLGMASGGDYGEVSYALGDRMTVSGGFTQQNTRYERSGMSPQQAAALVGLAGYSSAAGTMAVAYRPSNAVQLTGAYTRLRERNAILGMQSTSRDVIGGGAITEGITLGAAYQATPSLQIAASATMGRTRSAAEAAVSAKAFRTSSFQITVAKRGLLNGDDALRISLAQPLHVDGGTLAVTGLEVVDRQTGELGEVTRKFALPRSKRPLVGEIQYGRSAMNGQAELSLFGRAQLQGQSTGDQTASAVAGARMRIRY
jgi:hypothetical protein